MRPGLSARWNARCGAGSPHGTGEIPLHDLHVIDVVLEMQVVRAHPLHDAERLFRAGQEETGDVARVDRLDQQFYPCISQPFGREFQVPDENVLQLLPIGPRGRDAGQAVHLPAAQRPGIVDRRIDATAEFLDTVGQDGDAALAARPVARRQVEQHLREPVLLQPRRHRLGRMVVGTEIFHAPEAGAGGGIETVEEVVLGEEHGKIG